MIAFAPEALLAVGTYGDGGRNQHAELWDARTLQTSGSQQLVDPMLGGAESGSHVAVAFNNDGTHLATVVNDVARLWDTKRRVEIATLTTHSARTITFGRDGSSVTVSEDADIVLWDVGTGQTRRIALEPEAAHPNSIVFNAAASLLITAGPDNAIRFWDIRTQQRAGEPLCGHRGTVRDVALNPDGTLLASRSSDGTLLLWDIARRQPAGLATEADNKFSLKAVAFSPDGALLATGGYDGLVRLWDIRTRQPIGHPLTGHRAAITCIAFTPEATLLATGSTDNTVHLWDVGKAPLMTNTKQTAS